MIRSFAIVEDESTVSSDAVRLVIVVVANVDVPYTRSVPDAERLPKTSAANFVFSTQVDPFQYSVELVADPLTIVPDTAVQ